MFIPCAVKYALCFYARCKFYCAFFLRVLKHNYFRWFSFWRQEKMAGIENRSNYCFLSSLLHCVIAKAKLRPKLITGTTTPTTRKKAESDLDYNPENDEDTQDTEEDVRLEKTAVCEQAKKGYILFENIILCIIVSTK